MRTNRVVTLSVVAAVVAVAGAMAYGVAVEEPAAKEVPVRDTGHKSVHAQWTNGPSSDPSFFPIGVWAQAPSRAARYKEIGVNLFLSLHGGPTEKQLADLKKAGMKTICAQNDFALKHLDDPTIIGWMHGDEPDNFTKNAEGKWVPKHKPDVIIADYERIRKNDPTRPVLLNLGQGVANDGWKGGWAKAPDYQELVKGCDIVSYDIYPACSTRPEVAGKLELCAKGVDRLRTWSDDRKIVWFITEAAHIQNPNRMATPDEMRFEVWSALVHGARGIVYFCHQWKPKRDFAFPINDPTVKAAVTGINKQIAELAPVLNSPTDSRNGASVTSSNSDVPVDVITKRHGEAVYVFAVAMRRSATKAAFGVPGLPGQAVAEVLGEDRTIKVSGGRFADGFKPYGVHLYKITAGE